MYLDIFAVIISEFLCGWPSQKFANMTQQSQWVLYVGFVSCSLTELASQLVREVFGIFYIWRLTSSCYINSSFLTCFFFLGGLDFYYHIEHVHGCLNPNIREKGFKLSHLVQGEFLAYDIWILLYGGTLLPYPVSYVFEHK